MVYEEKVYIANGQDPEHGEGVGHMYCIDATKRGDITKTGMVWHYDKIRRSISTPAIKDGIVYQADFSGFLHALDAKTGQVYWTHDLFAAVWGSPMLIDGKIYTGRRGRRRGDHAGRQNQESHRRDQHGQFGVFDAVPANGVLYISNRNQLYALAETPAAKPAATAENKVIMKHSKRVLLPCVSLFFNRQPHRRKTGLRFAVLTLPVLLTAANPRPPGTLRNRRTFFGRLPSPDSHTRVRSFGAIASS